MILYYKDIQVTVVICIEIAGKFRRRSIQGIFFEICYV